MAPVRRAQKPTDTRARGWFDIAMWLKIRIADDVPSLIAAGVAIVGFMIHVSDIATHNESFGTMGGAIILLIWLWFSSLVILIGGKINPEMEHQPKADATADEPKPLGQRNAQMAYILGAKHG